MRKCIGYIKNIELIQGNINEIKNFKADVVFLNFKNCKDFSLLNEINKDSLISWLKTIKNLVILLPKYIEISELAIIFYDFFELNQVRS